MAAGSAFIILSPLMWIIMVLIHVSHGKQIFFRHFRPGKGGQAFGIVKFCTMTNVCDVAGYLLPDAQRLTRIGRFLRSTSLDELQELWYVDNWSLALDLRIILMTVLKVVQRDGISAKDDATMPEFMGSREEHKVTLGKGKC